MSRELKRVYAVSYMEFKRLENGTPALQGMWDMLGMVKENFPNNYNKVMNNTMESIRSMIDTKKLCCLTKLGVNGDIIVIVFDYEADGKVYTPHQDAHGIPYILVEDEM